MGRAIIMVAGQSGVGKSTLVNAVLGIDLAAVGSGIPVTTHCEEFQHQSKPITLLDTRGLELADFVKTLSALESEIVQRQRDPINRVHIAWVCISERSARIQPGELQLIAMLRKHRVPTIVVVTKALNDATFVQKVKELTGAEHVARVRAISERLEEDDVTLPPKGLDDLVQRTYELMPEAMESAFAAAQVISAALKRKSAMKVVALAVTAAAAIAAAPIPITGAVALVPVQLSMLVGITVAFGLNMKVATMASLFGGVLGASATTVVGRMTVGALLKFIPGLGSLAGGMISGAVAGTLTYGLGVAFIEVLVAAKWTGDDTMDWDNIREAFIARLRLGKDFPETA